MLVLVGNKHAAAQSAANVLVIVNDASEASRTVSDYYIHKRNVPPANVCHVTTKTDETITRAEFELRIMQPIGRCITAAFAQDRILYIVLTKGMPIRIEGTTGREGTVASVDSELTLLYRRLLGVVVRPEGPVPNPYFLGAQPDSRGHPFTHERADIYLVTRLDGFTVDDVLKLIDHGMTDRTNGRIILDEKGHTPDKGNEWLAAAAKELKALGFSGAELDTNDAPVTHKTAVMGYYSWGSNDPAIKIRHFDLAFVPGAIGAMYVSSDARTLKEPPAEWTIGVWDKPATYYAGSPQSLMGDLIRDGITGVAGHVAEPYLDATIRPDVLFPSYVVGATLAEAFYQAMPYLSWQTIVVGDPLCAPFRQGVLAPDAIEKGIDVRTELPAIFSARRLDLMTRSGVKVEAAAATLRAESRMNRQNVDGAIEALEQATAAEPRLVADQSLLATLYLSRNQYDKAVERYRKVVEITPNDVMALNNLAYTLAVQQNSPQEALPFAQRAVALAAKEPVIRDTLAWVQHLLKDDAEAMSSARIASAGAPANADVRWHTAVILAANNELADAQAELDAALKLNPKVGDTKEVQQLRERLAGDKGRRD